MVLFRHSALQKHLKLQEQLVVDKTDKEIDQMVYQLYGLSEDEIEIMEAWSD